MSSHSQTLSPLPHRPRGSRTGLALAVVGIFGKLPMGFVSALMLMQILGVWQY
jgi:hypothetical protein